MNDSLTAVVHGRPAPQGSKRVTKTGHVMEQSPHLPAWRTAVSDAAVAAMQANGFQPHKDAPYALFVVFTLARPGHHWRSGKHSDELKASAPAYPATMPDLDKLLRSTLDGLADAGALANDSRVVAIAAEKVYPAGHLDALDAPGAVIVLRRVT